jgi:hypothetical protein
MSKPFNYIHVHYREYIAIKLANSNLIFVIAEQECPHCAEDKSAEMDLLQEPETFDGLSILQLHSLSSFIFCNNVLAR